MEPLDSEMLRGLAIEVLAEQPSTQWLSFLHRVGVEARSRKLSPPHQEELTPPEADVLLEVVWGFIAQGVLIPGPAGTGSQGWPFFRLTSFGKLAVRSAELPPHDPDGYLRRLKLRVPAITTNADYDLYLGEALNSFLSGNYIATVLMVGVTAELASRALVGGMISWLPSREGATLQRCEEWKAAAVFEEVRKRLEHRRNKLPEEYARDFEVHLGGIAAVFRNQRNRAGHPTGRRYSRAEAFNMLQMLPNYLEFLHGVADWMLQQPSGSG